jgi:hypothetical protein
MVSILRSLRRGVAASRRRGLVLPALAACALVLAAGVAGCGSTPASTPLVGSTNCGKIIGHFSEASDQGAQGAERCFFQAYKHCQGATLGFVLMGIDTSDTYDFTVQPKSSGGCALAAVDAYFFASGGGRTTVKTYTCSGVMQQADTLVVQGCGAGGDITVSGILLPATVTPTR